MTKKGALKSVYIVNDDELRVNGGRWLLQSGPAIRVRGFTADTLGDRKVVGGDAQPIFVLGENDIRANGGQFRLKGGQAIPVTSVIATARGVIQGNAIPVWPVDDDGNFDSSFAGSYSQRVLATQPNNLIGYWIMGEAAGGISIDSSPEGNDGAYTAVTLGQPGIGDGNTSPLFDGATSFNNIYSAAFAADFDGAEGTLLFWVKASGVGVWGGAVVRTFCSIAVGNNNRVGIFSSGFNSIIWRRLGGGISEQFSLTGFSSIEWIPIAITWSEAADEVKGYIFGGQQGATQIGLGAFAGALGATLCTIGARTTGPIEIWGGNLAHTAIWDIPLTGTEIADLSVVS